MKKAKSWKQAIMLKCWDCMGHYFDGKKDCQNTVCPLYSWMPYAQGEPDLSVFDYSPKRVGHVTLEEIAKSVTDEQRRAASERARKLHETRG